VNGFCPSSTTSPPPIRGAEASIDGSRVNGAEGGYGSWVAARAPPPRELAGASSAQRHAVALRTRPPAGTAQASAILPDGFRIRGKTFPPWLPGQFQNPSKTATWPFLPDGTRLALVSGDVPGGAPGLLESKVLEAVAFEIGIRSTPNLLRLLSRIRFISQGESSRV
jgi:hypothetical protein